MKVPQLSLNQTQSMRLDSALQQLQDLSSQAAAAVCVGDVIPVGHDDGILRPFEADSDHVQTAFEKMKQLYTESRLPIIEALARQASIGLHTYGFEASSCRVRNIEEFLLSGLMALKKHHYSLLTIEQLKELDAMVQSLLIMNPFHDLLSSVTDSESGLTRNNNTVYNVGDTYDQDTINEPLPGDHTSKKPNLMSTKEGERIIGALHAPNPWGDIDHLVNGCDDQQKALIMKERARRSEEQNKLFSAKKLSLVLDLDHTLLNSAKFSDLDPMQNEKLRKIEEIDHEKSQRHLFRFEQLGVWTKLRPGIWNFLERASKLFEMHIYTLGNKLYATEIARVLDPTGTLFAGRVISRGDDDDPLALAQMGTKTKGLDGVLGMESAVVIIDDCSMVWPHNKHNLIVVERYNYFPYSCNQFAIPGRSLLEVKVDERVDDGSLASSLSVIERIHANFFSHSNLNEVDVRNILASEQQKILAGCRIVFSRIFQVGEANPHFHPLWQLAEQFGAVCTDNVDEQVTHVVAISRGTEKVKWALSMGRFVVQPGWVEASALLYRRAKEHDFAVNQLSYVWSKFTTFVHSGPPSNIIG